MLAALGVDRLALLSNNPDKAEQLQRLGLEITERVPTRLHVSPANLRYLRAKARPHRPHAASPTGRGSCLTRP